MAATTAAGSASHAVGPVAANLDPGVASAVRVDVHVMAARRARCVTATPATGRSTIESRCVRLRRPERRVDEEQGVEGGERTGEWGGGAVWRGGRGTRRRQRSGRNGEADRRGGGPQRDSARGTWCKRRTGRSGAGGRMLRAHAGSARQQARASTAADTASVHQCRSSRRSRRPAIACNKWHHVGGRKRGVIRWRQCHPGASSPQTTRANRRLRAASPRASCGPSLRAPQHAQHAHKRAASLAWTPGGRCCGQSGAPQARSSHCRAARPREASRARAQLRAQRGWHRDQPERTLGPGAAQGSRRQERLVRAKSAAEPVAAGAEPTTASAGRHSAAALPPL